MSIEVIESIIIIKVITFWCLVSIFSLFTLLFAIWNINSARRCYFPFSLFSLIHESTNLCFNLSEKTIDTVKLSLVVLITRPQISHYFLYFFISEIINCDKIAQVSSMLQVVQISLFLFKQWNPNVLQVEDNHFLVDLVDHELVCFS